MKPCEVCTGRAKKAPCCDRLLCSVCVEVHTCPRGEELGRIASDPKALAKWRRDHAPEESLTTLTIAALNKLPGVKVWRTKRKQGARAKDELNGVLDIGGHVAPFGLAIYVENKGAHKAGCSCPSCADQRYFAAEARAAGCIVVEDVREPAQAVDGVLEQLARRSAA